MSAHQRSTRTPVTAFVASSCRPRALVLLLVGGALLAAAAVPAQQAARGSRYLFVWSGDADRQHSDFLAVLDVDPSSASYGEVLRTVPVGESGTDPHHTEHAFTPGRPLFASGFAGNQVFRFDLANPLRPRLLGRVDAVATLNLLHSFERLPNGNVLGTMQATTVQNTGPGGLIEFDNDGRIVRTAGAATPGSVEPHPYSLVVLPDHDRVVTTSGRMIFPRWDPRRGSGASEPPPMHLQLWRLSDLRLLKTVALEAPAGTRLGQNPYEVRRLPSGDILVSSVGGGLYRVTGLDADTFGASLVYDMKGAAFVPVIVDRFWVQALSSSRRVVSLDVSDPSHPKEVSSVQFDDRQAPHWLAFDPVGDRIVVANGNAEAEARLWMMRIDRRTGTLRLDETFKHGGDRAGISFERDAWPHGNTGAAVPHGSVFGQ